MPERAIRVAEIHRPAASGEPKGQFGPSRLKTLQFTSENLQFG
jgi:hypothetical protein